MNRRRSPTFREGSKPILDRSAATGEGQPKPKPKSTELLQSSGGGCGATLVTSVGPTTIDWSHLQRCQVLLRNLASLRPPPWYYEAEVSDRRRRKRVSLVCLSVHCREDEAKRLPLILIVYCKQIVPGFIQKKKLCVDGTRTADCQDQYG